MVGQFLLFLARRKRAWNSHSQPPLSRSFGPDTATSCSESQAVVRRNCRSWPESPKQPPWLESCCLLANSSLSGAGLTLREGRLLLESSEECTPNVSHIFNSRPSASCSLQVFEVRTYRCLARCNNTHKSFLSIPKTWRTSSLGNETRQDATTSCRIVWPGAMPSWA